MGQANISLSDPSSFVALVCHGPSKLPLVYSHRLSSPLVDPLSTFKNDVVVFRLGINQSLVTSDAPALSLDALSTTASQLQSTSNSVVIAQEDGGTIAGPPSPPGASVAELRRAVQSSRKRTHQQMLDGEMEGLVLNAFIVSDDEEQSATKRGRSTTPGIQVEDNRKSAAANERLFHILSTILRVQARRRALLALRGTRAQLVLDFLQLVLQSGYHVPGLRKHALIALRRISAESMLYPRCYVLKNIALGSLEAAGGFCDVYKARHGGLSLCMKVVRACQGSQLDKILRVFAAETAVWAELHHPNILPFYGIYYSDDTQKRVSLVSPWMLNGTVVAYVNSNPTLPRKLFIHDITCGLEYLHSRDVIHGDLKGLNVLVNSSGRAVIADFGLSTIRTDKTFGFTYTTIGISARSTRYASPELLDEGARPTQASDVWAIGCVWYEILSRRSPFHECSSDAQIILKLIDHNLPAQSKREPVGDPVDKIGDKIWELLYRCWESKPTDRPTCSQIIKGLSRIGLVYERDNEAQSERLMQESRHFRSMMGMTSGSNADLAHVEEILGEVGAIV